MSTLASNRPSGMVLRAVGCALVALAYLVGSWCFPLLHPAMRATLADYLAILVVYVLANVGVVLAALGGHLFDQLELPPGWHRYSAAWIDD